MKILLILLFLISCSKETSNLKLIKAENEVESILDLKVVDGSVLELDTNESITLSSLLNKTVSYNITVKNFTSSTKTLPSDLTIQLQGPSSEIITIEQKHNCPTSLSRFRSCTISLSLMSSTPIVGSGYVLVDGLQIPVTFDIKDEEVIEASVSVTPELINFGEVQKNTIVKQYVDIKNITVNKISVPIEVTNGNGITVSAGTCGSITTINLDRFRSCKLEVSFEIGDLTESTTFNITDFLKIQDINVAITANYTSLEKVSPIVLVNASSFIDNVIDVSSPQRLEFWNNSPTTADMFYDVALLNGKVDFKSTCPSSLSRYRKCYIYLSNPKESFTLEASFVGKNYIVKNSTAVTRLCEVSDITTTPEVGDLSQWLAGSYTISGTVVDGVPNCSFSLCEGKTPNYTDKMCEESLACSVVDAQSNGWDTSNFENIAGDKIVRQDNSSVVTACKVSSCLSGFNLDNNLKKCSMTETRACESSDVTTPLEVGDLNTWLVGSYTISGTVVDGVFDCSFSLCEGKTPNYTLKMCEQAVACVESDAQANGWDIPHAITYSGDKIVRQDSSADVSACKVDSCETNYSVDAGSKRCLAITRTCEISDVITTPEIGDLNLWFAGSYTINGEVIGNDQNCYLDLCSGQTPNYTLKMCEQSVSCSESDAQANGWDTANFNELSGTKIIRQNGSEDVSSCSVSICSNGFTLNSDLKQCIPNERACTLEDLGIDELFNGNVTGVVTGSDISACSFNCNSGYFADVALQQCVEDFSAGPMDNQSFGFFNGFDRPIYAFEKQLDGKMIVGGSFLEYLGEKISPLVRLNLDGSIDRSFNFHYHQLSNIGWDYVTSVAIQDDGNILVGFANTEMLKVNKDGTLNHKYPVTKVNSIVIQSDGKILIGGGFTRIPNITGNRIMRYNTDNSYDTTFLSTGVNGPVKDIKVLNDGIIIIGDFSRFNGHSSNYFGLMKLSPIGFTMGGYEVILDSYPLALDVDNDGKILVGGSNYLKRFNSDLSVDTSFPSISQSSKKILSLDNGNIILSSTNKRYLYNNDGTLINSTNIGSRVDHVVKQYSDGLYIGGEFYFGGFLQKYNHDLIADNSLSINNNFSFENSYESQSKLTIKNDTLIQLNRTDNFTIYQEQPFKNLSNFDLFDKTIKSSFYCDLNNNDKLNSIYVMTILDNNKILLGGFNFLVKLNEDCTYDNSFTRHDFQTSDIKIQNDGKIIASGMFNIERFNIDGTKDTSFNTIAAIGTKENSLFVQNDGKILVIEYGINVLNKIETNLKRFNSDGTIDTSFNSSKFYKNNDNSLVKLNKVITQDDGKILVIGSFDKYDSSLVSNIVRLNTDGTIDTSFTTDAILAFDNREIYDVKIQNDGKILVGGTFTKGIMRLNNNGLEDDTFHINLGFSIYHPSFTGFHSAYIYKIDILSNNKIFVQGQFKYFNGLPYRSFIILESDGTPEISE